MKWIYIIVGILLFMVISKLISQQAVRYSHVTIIHSGAQP